TAIGRNDQIVVAVVNQQLSPFSEKRRKLRGVVRYVRTKPVVKHLECIALDRSAVFDCVVQVNCWIIEAQTENDASGKIPIRRWRRLAPGLRTLGVGRRYCEL